MRRCGSGGRTIWRDVDLRIERGEFVAILGANGAGKTALLNVLLGLLGLARGQAAVLGAPPGRKNSEIGYLPQRRSFDATTRIRGVDVVRLGLDGARFGLPLPPVGRRGRRAAGARACRRGDRARRATGYATRPIGAVSGGEQQRLLIAQALARRRRC